MAAISVVLAALLYIPGTWRLCSLVCTASEVEASTATPRSHTLQSTSDDSPGNFFDPFHPASSPTPATTDPKTPAPGYQQPVASAAASAERSSSTIKPLKPVGRGPPGGTATGIGGAGQAPTEPRPLPQAAEASTTTKVAEGDGAKEENEETPPGVRGYDRGVAEEAEEQGPGDAPNEGEGSNGGKGEKQAEAGAEATTTAEEDTAVVSGDEGGVDGENAPEEDAAAACSPTPAPLQAGKETAAVAMHEGRESGEEVVRGGTKDSQAANREAGGGHDQAEDENSAGGEDRAGSTAGSYKLAETEAETAGEQVTARIRSICRTLEYTRCVFHLAPFPCQRLRLGGEYLASSKYVDILECLSCISVTFWQTAAGACLFLCVFNWGVLACSDVDETC